MINLGTGKTTLVSRVIKDLQRESKDHKPVVYFYFGHHDQNRNKFQAMLVSVLAQLVSVDETLLEFAHDRLASTGFRDAFQMPLGELQSLVATALQSQRFCFVVLDALDECSSEHGQCQYIVKWLNDFTPERKESPSSFQSENILRIFVSGRRNGDLDKWLRTWPTIRLEAVPGHMHDIRQFVENRSQYLQNKFSLGKQTKLDIVQGVTSRAQGMAFPT